MQTNPFMRLNLIISQPASVHLNLNSDYREPHQNADSQVTSLNIISISKFGPVKIKSDDLADKSKTLAVTVYQWT